MGKRKVKVKIKKIWGKRRGEKRRQGEEGNKSQMEDRAVKYEERRKEGTEKENERRAWMKEAIDKRENMDHKRKEVWRVEHVGRETSGPAWTGDARERKGRKKSQKEKIERRSEGRKYCEESWRREEECIRGRPAWRRRAACIYQHRARCRKKSRQGRRHQSTQEIRKWLRAI